MEKNDNSLADKHDELSPKVAQALERLENKKRQISFKNPDFNFKCIAFFSTTVEAFIQSGKNDFLAFCIECRKHKANQIISAIIDRYTSHVFQLDCDTLSYIGTQLGKCGFDDEAVRCFERAEELITD